MDSKTIKTIAVLSGVIGVMIAIYGLISGFAISNSPYFYFNDDLSDVITSISIASSVIALVAIIASTICACFSFKSEKSNKISKYCAFASVGILTLVMLALFIVGLDVNSSGFADVTVVNNFLALRTKLFVEQFQTILITIFTGMIIMTACTAYLECEKFFYKKIYKSTQQSQNEPNETK